MPTQDMSFDEMVLGVAGSAIKEQGAGITVEA